MIGILWVEEGPKGLLWILMVSYDLDFVGGIQTTNRWIHMDGTQLAPPRQSQLKPVIKQHLSTGGFVKKSRSPYPITP